MFKTLRSRLILSHVLPLLIIIPVVGISLIYVLETRVLLPGLAQDATEEAQLIADITRDDSRIWSNPIIAQAVVSRMSEDFGAQIEFYDPFGHLLASTHPSPDEPGNSADFRRASEGQIVVRTLYSLDENAELSDVVAPVMNSEQQLLGYVRIVHQYTSVSERFIRLRFVVVAILVISLVVGGIVGWVLALDIGRPLHEVTVAVKDLAARQHPETLLERGPQEIQSLARAFNSLVARLGLLENNRRQLLANLVHELGRPLGALHSAAQALLGGADRDEALRHDLLTGVEDEIQRLRRLLEDLTRLYDKALGPLTLTVQPIALDGWLARVAAPWREEAAAKGIEWQTSMSSNLPVIQADPDRLAQAVGNLLSNAVKYTQPGGTICLSAEVIDDEVQLIVADNGLGIPPAELPHIFEPFYRGNQTQRFPEGMGLGLTIARDLVAAHSGRIEVDSPSAGGSRFRIILPLSVTATLPS